MTGISDNAKIEAADLVKANSWRQRGTLFMHRYHARRAATADVSTTFVAIPEPHTIGVVARGQQLIAGHFLFSGMLVDAKAVSIWDIARDNPTVADEIQGCAWLDDLAAVGDERARERAQAWVFDWIARYGDGRSDGWTPGITGRRVMRWINHGHFLLRGQEKRQSDQFFQSLARQTLFLSKRWPATAQGLRRFEAIMGTIYAGLSLKGMADHTPAAVAALAVDCDTQIDASGAISTRNPEELLDILSLLIWVTQSMAKAELDVPAPIQNAIARVVPTLRALRHADGTLARFHGGGGGIEGRLDEALAAARLRAVPGPELHMGFARIVAGRTTLIADAAPPPSGAHSARAHASTLAIELTSGRRPLIVNCGSGGRFGDEWRRASRATPSHSTMMIDGMSSSHLGPARRSTNGQEHLINLPTYVQGQISQDDTDRKLELSHNGYQDTHGLTHARTLQMSMDGRALHGEDILTTLDQGDNTVFDRALANIGPLGVPYTIRFHLHPDVDAALDLGRNGISMRLMSGEVWIFRHDGQARLSLAGSVYLQNGRLKPRATQQVVLSGAAMSYATRVRWSFAKAQDTPDAVRDLVQADPMDAID